MSYWCQKCEKKGGLTDFVSDIRYLKDHPNFAKSIFLIRYDPNVCKSKSIANESLELQLSIYKFMPLGLIKQIRSIDDVLKIKPNL